MVAFCYCLKSLPEIKVKCFGLFPLAEEISKHYIIYSFLWLLVLLVKTYNEKEHAEQGKLFEEKMSSKKRKGATSCIQ